MNIFFICQSSSTDEHENGIVEVYMNEVMKKILEEELDDGRAPVTPNEKEKSFDIAMGAFMLGLETGDCSLTRLSISVVDKYYRERKERKGSAGWKVIRYTAFLRALRLLESGIRFERGELEDIFNPFAGTPEEIVEVYRMNDGSYGELFDDIATFLDNSDSDEDSCFAASVEKYLLLWLNTLLDVVRNDEAFTFNDIYGLVLTLIDYPGLFPVLEKIVRRFPDEISEEENGVDFLLNSAIEADNENAFFLLLSIPGIFTDEIRAYPSRSLKILETLFSMNLVMPGTDAGRSAFSALVRERSPSKEILERTTEYSYLKADSFFSYPPLEKAVLNRNFDTSLCLLLLGDGDELRLSSFQSFHLPPLCTALSIGRRDAVDALVALGSDLHDEDEWGNNVLHYTIGMGEYRSLTNVISISPPELLSKRNRYGSTPLDYLAFPESADIERISLQEALEGTESFIVAGPSRSVNLDMRRLREKMLGVLSPSVEVRSVSVLRDVLESGEGLTVLIDAALLYEEDREEAERLIPLLESKKNIRVIEGIYPVFAPVFRSIFRDGPEARLILPQMTAFGYEYTLCEKFSIRLEDNEALLRKGGRFSIVDLKHRI